MKNLTILIILIMITITACGAEPSPEQLPVIEATVPAITEADLDEIDEAVADAAPELSTALNVLEEQAGIEPVPQAQAQAAEAAPEAATSGERVEATAVPPQQRPRIVYFFAAVPSQSGIEAGIAYYLEYTTDNANRVEIFGNVMENPQEGNFPIYGDSPSNQWVLWAANDFAWVEQNLIVSHDSDVGTTLSDISVNSNTITLSLRDPQLQDGDVVNIDLNGVRVLDRFPTSGRHVSFPLTLQSGPNTLVVTAQNQGVSGPMVAELSFSNVVGGSPVQMTSALSKDQTQSMTIYAP
jgi:hypothetical protein